MKLPKQLRQCIFPYLVFSGWIKGAFADCNVYTPAFPPAPLDPNSDIIRQARLDIGSILHEAVAEPGLETVSFSIAVTSKTETLFELHHTATDRDEHRPGRKTVDGKSCYRIASCTKPFTVLALLQLQKAGKINLDDPINKYVAELDDPHNGTLPWKDITIRTLVSQFSGMPRDMAQGDSLTVVDDPISKGLPPLSPSEHHEIRCDSIVNYSRPCTRNDLLDRLQNALPIFAPKQQASYSNLNFELLSLALANVSSMSYETLIQTQVLDKLNLTSTSFTPPPDSLATLPKNNYHYWDFLIGIANPTGGLYSSTEDLSKFIRHFLTSYNGISPALNWVQPAAYSLGINNLYGAPWEIFRTTEILPYTNRPVTFVTKSGALPGYTSFIVSVPDYDFGYTVLVAGPAGDLASTALETVGVRMVQAADEIAHANLRAKYTGSWRARDLNSSISFAHSLGRGLWVDAWISNGTDVLGEIGTIGFPGSKKSAGRNQYLQLVPTLLYKDQENVRGEIWRVIAHQVPASKTTRQSLLGYRGAFRDYCIQDIDIGSYAGVPLGEVVFWDQLDDGSFGGVELSGFRIRLEKSIDKDKDKDERLVVQT